MAVDVRRPLKRTLRRAYEAGARAYLTPILRREFEQPPIGELREYVFQFEFAMRAVARHMPQTVLDVGSGMSAWPHLLASCGVRVTAVDEIDSYWGSMFNRHYYVQRDDITASNMRGEFDLVTCLGVLTCIEDDGSAMLNLLSLVRPGGHLVVTCAYNHGAPVSNAYELPGASYGADFPFICRMFSAAEVERWTVDHRVEVEERQFFRIFSGDYWAHGERLQPPVRCSEDEAQYTAICFRKS